MTEKEWMESNSLRTMFEHLGTKVSARKLRLFACACCRHLPQVLRERCKPEIWVALAAAEQFADGSGTERQLQQARKAAETEQKRLFELEGDGSSSVWAAVSAVVDAAWQPEARVSPTAPAISAMDHAAVAVAYLKDDEDWNAVLAAERKAHALLLRDIIGNPFKAATLNPKCLNPTVKHLAESIYQDRQFDRLPILADALEEAGCQQEEMLKHLRGGGEHVQGCWALDPVLGKS